MKFSTVVVLVAALFFAVLSYFLFLQVDKPEPHCDVDSKAYIANAKLFAANNSFAWQAPGRPYYVLGYSFFLALIFKVFGQSDAAVIFLQVLLALFSMLLLFRVGTMLAGRRVGTIAVGLLAINIGYLTFVQFYLTEILLSLLLLLFFERFVSFVKDKSSQTLMQSAGALGLSVLVKPAALYFFIMLVPLFFVASHGRCRIFLRFATLWLVVFLSPIALYMGHNKMVFGHWYLSGLDSENMLYWFFPNVLAHEHGTTSDEERITLRAMSRDDVVVYFKREAFGHPFTMTTVWMKNVAKTWLGLFSTNLKVLIEPTIAGGSISFFRVEGSCFKKIYRYMIAGTERLWLCAVACAEGVWTVVRLFFCGIAILWFIRRRAWSLLYLFAAYLFYFSMITGHDGCARFRMLFEFVLIVLMAIGLSCCVLWLKRKGKCS